ncbi:MAG TPA: hypothetical protein VL860_12670, partial [Planctomycetota bacterium]|nr:hypothetical protein [Planctomycetota bacterium]
MEIIFCKKCGRRIKQDELQKNQVTIVEGAYFCTTCQPITQSIPGPNDPRRKSSAIVRPKTTAQSAVLRTQTGKHSAVENVRPPSAHSLPAFKPKPEAKPPVAIYAGVAIGVLAIVILILVFSMGGNPPPKPPDPHPPEITGPVVNVPPDHGPTQVIPIPPPPGLQQPVVPGVDSPELAALFQADIDTSIRESLKGPRPKLVAAAMPAAPVLDGDLSDPCWAAAAVLDNFTVDSTQRPAAETGETSTVRVVLSQGMIFISGEGDVPEGTDKMVATKANRDDPLWEEESFEIFLLSPTGKQRYAQIVVSPRGVVADQLGRLGETHDSKVNFPSLKAVAKMAPNKWTFELAIAPSDLSGLPSGRWLINAYRNRVPQGGTHKYISWKPTGGDYHAWPQYDPIEFAGATPAEIDKAREDVRKNLPEYNSVRKAAAGEKFRPLPFDALDITPKPRTVALPYCPAFTMQDIGTACDSPMGSAGYFGATMTLKPDASEVGLLRMGSLTAGTTLNLHLTARTNGGTTEQPRVFGLAFRASAGAPGRIGLIGGMIVDGQMCGFAETRAAGAAAVSHAGLVPIVTLTSAGKPVDVDYCIEPERVCMFVNGRLMAEMPWPAGSKTAADLLGLFVQNSGLDIYKLLISPGFIDKSLELPPLSAAAGAPDLIGGQPGNGGLELMPDISAAHGLCIVAHGKPIASDSDIANNPALDFNLLVHRSVPYRVYARIRSGGGQPGQTAPKFLLQVGAQADATQAAFAPKMSAAYPFQRLATNSHDWGWVTLTAPGTQKPVMITFANEGEAPFRLIAATPEAAIDQIVLLPSEQPCRGLEINDDSWYVSGSLPAAFDLKALQKSALVDANNVRALSFRIDEAAPPPLTVQNPVGVSPSPGTGGSADGFVSQSSIAAMRWTRAADGMTGFPEIAAAKLAVPAPLINMHFGAASHAEWAAAAGASFQFNLSGEAMVFLAFDPAVPASKAMQDELLNDGFERSTLLLQQTQPSAAFQVIRRRYPAGLVRFLHNLAGAP